MQEDLMNTYLQQQQQQSRLGNEQQPPRRLEQALVNAPDNMSLDEFKHQVKLWIELDNQIKQMSQIIKEKKKIQRMLTDKILAFMARYNIEDLNTKDGKLRYKVTHVKPSVKQTTIKKKLYDYFEHDSELANKVVNAVFDDTAVQKIEKPALRRLKGVRIMNV
jgi:hypothetical protein